MNRTRQVLPGVTLLVAIALLVVAWRQMQRADAAGAGLRAARERRDRWQRQVAQAEARLAELERARATDKAKAAGPATAAADATPAKPADGGGATMTIKMADVDPRTAVATDAKLRALHLEAFRADLDGVWGPVFARLKLSPDKIEQFKLLQLKHEQRRLDVTAVAAEQNLGLNDPAVQKMRSDDGTVRAREVRALLGNDDFKVYSQYNHDLVLQPVVADVAARTYLSATPLTLAEGATLMTILSANSQKRANGFVRENTVNWTQAMAQAEASGTLSAPTLAALRNYAEAQKSEQNIGERWAEIAAKVAGKKDGAMQGTWLPGLVFKSSDGR